MAQDISMNDVISFFKGIEEQATLGSSKSRKVADALTQIASDMHSLADKVTALSRTLNGGSLSKDEPVGKKTVIIKTKEDEKAYKESKKTQKPKQKKKKKYNLSPEMREKKRQIMLEVRAKTLLKKKLNAVVNANAEEERSNK